MSIMTIPVFAVSDQTFVKGRGEVFILNRKDASHSGVFSIETDVHFSPAGGDSYPTGSLIIRSDLIDSLRGTFIASSIEIVNSYGLINPTFFITGRCKPDAENNPQGCRFWVVIVNNGRSEIRHTLDVAGFAIHDHNGNRIAYGMGPVKGDFSGKAEF